jgi:hypothetical protein
MTLSAQLTSGQPPAATVVMLPFASTRVVEVELSCYPNEAGGRPVTTYPLYEGVGPDLVQTGDHAAEVAYRLARETVDLSAATYYIGFRLKGLPAAAKVRGESAGLAMAIAIYCRLTSSPFGRIAATGRLTSFDDGGRIDRVEGIQAKLQGVLQVLSAGDTMFYPRPQDPDIADAVRAVFLERGIRLIAVDSVREALSCLNPKTAEAKPTKAPARRNLRPAALLIGLLGCLLAAGTVYWSLIKTTAGEGETVAISRTEADHHPENAAETPGEVRDPRLQLPHQPALKPPTPPQFRQGFE